MKVNKILIAIGLGVLALIATGLVIFSLRDTVEEVAEETPPENHPFESLETQTGELEVYDDKYVYATAEVYNHNDRDILARCRYTIGSAHAAVSPVRLDVLRPGSNSVDELITARLVGAVDLDDGGRVSVEGLSLSVSCGVVTQEDFANGDFYGY